MTAQCLATVATLSIVGDRARHNDAPLRAHLEGARQSRILIEQAKGYLARHHEESPNQAFRRSRTYSRQRGRRIAAVADDVVSRQLDLGRPPADGEARDRPVPARSWPATVMDGVDQTPLSALRGSGLSSTVLRRLDSFRVAEYWHIGHHGDCRPGPCWLVSP